MNKILSNKMIKAISAIEKMYPKQDVHLAINDLMNSPLKSRNRKG